jgi:hypothetical protein
MNRKGTYKEFYVYLKVFFDKAASEAEKNEKKTFFLLDKDCLLAILCFSVEEKKTSGFVESVENLRTKASFV